jgi:N-acyl-D-amino-acid deacylase
VRDPGTRAAIVEAGASADRQGAFRWDRMFPFTDPVDYEQPYERSVAGRAEARGVSPVEVILDATDSDPNVLFMLHINNYAYGDAEAVREMLVHPASVLGLADAGAHVATVCDASTPTTMLTHWARDRTRGERLSLEQVVRAQTRDTAELYGLTDRGVLAPGLLGDLNVIDFERLAVRPPELVHDLPGGARRLVQRARGYGATVKHGAVTVEDDELTAARPGRVVRG